jgi:putative endonuclease
MQLRSPPPTAVPPTPGDPRRALGRRGEQLAAAHLQRLGFRVLARNVRRGGVEIDIVAFDGSTLAFVEVKTRRARRDTRVHGEDPLAPLHRLGHRQRARLRRAAAAWLRERPRGSACAATVRFDAVGVTVDGRGRLLRLDHLEAAW